VRRREGKLLASSFNNQSPNEDASGYRVSLTDETPQCATSEWDWATLWAKCEDVVDALNAVSQPVHNIVKSRRVSCMLLHSVSQH
jgi:hypothetical protein